jgi:hypothetical protein
MRRTAIRHKSAKQAKVDRLRAKLRKELQEQDPMCRRCRTSPGTDLHERLRRSQGGDPTDTRVVTLICRGCHSDIHANPQEAREQGWLTFRRDMGGAA